MEDESNGISRRGALLVGLGSALAGAASAGLIVGSVRGDGTTATSETSGEGTASGSDSSAGATEPVDPHGVWQAGIERPATPQQQALFLVFSDVNAPGPWLRELGETITALCTTGVGLLDGPGDLSITVGLGPSMVAAVMPGGVGAESLPDFAGDDALTADHREGDLCLQLCGSDPVVLEFAAEQLERMIPGRRSFRQRAFRPPGEGTIVRSPIGFHDGISIPRSKAELEESVFLTEGALAGATIWVIRQFEIDVSGFRKLDLPTREAAIGRREVDGAPLSGGRTTDDVLLAEKQANGQYLVPVDAHVRRAHPSFIGAGLMLRRSYSYDNGGSERGLMFVSFQKEIRTFVATQRRLDESDALLEFATPQATFTFLALPGFDASRALGAGFFD